jgi:hypothetical protein
VLWQYDTRRSFDAVNGVPTRGGSISSGGAVVVGGREGLDVTDAQHRRHAFATRLFQRVDPLFDAEEPSVHISNRRHEHRALTAA